MSQRPHPWQTTRTRAWAMLIGLSCLSATPTAHAEHERHRATAPLLPLYQQECGSCHLAYPPRLLGAESWQRIMQGLSRHYGTDASLDAPTQATLSRWLGQQAGGRQRAAPPQDRITRSTWFVHEHDEVPASVWKDPAVRSAANCAACHSDATQGRFSEHALRQPAGLKTPWQQEDDDEHDD